MLDLIQRLANRPLTRQGLRFALVGVIATAVHYGILIALVEGAEMRPLTASTIGFSFGIAVSYALNRRYTFEKRPPIGSSFAKYFVLYAIGMILNGALLAIFMSLGAPYLLAQVGSTALVLFWNFLAVRFIVFG